jgi:hypothetical protein
LCQFSLSEAINVAHQSDPAVKLYQTDYGVEYPTKREKDLRLLQYCGSQADTSSYASLATQTRHS